MEQEIEELTEQLQLEKRMRVSHLFDWIMINSCLMLCSMQSYIFLGGKFLLEYSSSIRQYGELKVICTLNKLKSEKSSPSKYDDNYGKYYSSFLFYMEIKKGTQFPIQQHIWSYTFKILVFYCGVNQLPVSIKRRLFRNALLFFIQ